MRSLTATLYWCTCVNTAQNESSHPWYEYELPFTSSLSRRHRSHLAELLSHCSRNLKPLLHLPNPLPSSCKIFYFTNKRLSALRFKLEGAIIISLGLSRFLQLTLSLFPHDFVIICTHTHLSLELAQVFFFFFPIITLLQIENWSSCNKCELHFNTNYQ